MLTFRCRIPLVIAITAMLAFQTLATAQTQQSSRRNSIRNRERVARANWAPVRRNQPIASETPLTDPARHSSESLSDQPVVEVGSQFQDQSGVVRQAQAITSPGAIIDTPVTAPLDGQIYYEHDHGHSPNRVTVLDGGSLACDALSGCGCGDLTCDGGCDSMGCDGNCGDGCSTCGELISPNAWRPCMTLCLPQDGWVSFEYLAWWQDGMNLPPLITTHDGTPANNNVAGVLGQGGRTVFGGGNVLDDNFNGGRLRAGVWLDRAHTWSLSGEYFELDSESEGFSQTSNGSTILARPIISTTAGETSQIIALTGLIGGNVSATATSEFKGGGFHLRHLRCCDEGCSNGFFCGCPEHFCSRTEGMIGYRYLQLDESVLITETLTTQDVQGGAFALVDSFETRNQFNGIDFGWMNRRTRGLWSLDTSIRLAIGNTKQRVRIDGSTTITDPSTTPNVITHAGGLLTQSPGNIDTHEQDEFTVVPELGATLGYRLTDNLKATLGYTFIYWSNVARPGDQISRLVNPDLVPPQASPITGPIPAFEIDTTDYWVQGISFGGEYRW